MIAEAVRAQAVVAQGEGLERRGLAEGEFKNDRLRESEETEEMVVGSGATRDRRLLLT